jgi:mRNA interferase HigB
MRILSIKTLKDFYSKNPSVEQSLKAWIQEAELATWKNAAELKSQFRNASVLNARRVVFNIKGNSFRLIVDIEYRIKMIFIVWIGNHEQYNKINANTISYDKTNKK